MKKIILLILCITSLGLNAQNEINKTVSVDGPGWKKVARLDGAYGRGYNEVTLLTTGGSSTPRVAKISWFKGWSAYGGLNLSSVSDNGYWSDARITYDSTKAYLEINFTSAIPVLKVYLDQSAWIGGDILEGILPDGSGTVLLTAKFGRLNYGENDLFLSYNGNLGLGTSSPNAQLVVGNNFGATISGNSGGNAVFGTNLAIQNGGINHNKLFTPYSHSNSYGYSGFKAAWGEISFYANRVNTVGNEIISPEVRMLINKHGNIGIGTTTPDAKLAVNGNIHTKEVKVDLIGWADYVFKEDYNLPTLQQVEDHISNKGHLINIPSASEVAENGIQLGEMNAKLLEKIEELTLYAIAQEKKLKEQEKINNQLKTNNQNLEARLAKVETLLSKE
ncbi:tail fiber protein [uncultured Aquimarina sp.]|uniref:tail fiber protein n=1 Tax=uncultured Aquimarina sp. TaxID=575652 RepID=UPI002627F9B6|nr:tail fiber protein [uncultured Aquimarina sp.]